MVGAFFNSGALLWQNFACLLWEEVRALTDLRQDSKKFKQRTHECEFSWTLFTSHIGLFVKMLPQQANWQK